MHKTSSSRAHDSGIDAFIDSIDPRTVRDASHLHEIAEARKAVDSSNERLREAVSAARKAGDSWTMIGVALRTSKQNAYRKYGTVGAPD